MSCLVSLSKGPLLKGTLGTTKYETTSIRPINRIVLNIISGTNLNHFISIIRSQLFGTP